MKTNLKLSLIKTMAALLLLFAATSFAAHISVEPENGEVAIGNNFTVNIVISGLEDAEDLGAFDLTLDYDASVIEFVGYQLGDALGSLDAVEALDFSDASMTGSLNLYSVSLLSESELASSQSNAFKLARVTFKGLSVGETPLALSVSNLGDALGDPTIEFTTTGGNVSVPEPSAVALLCSSLAFFAVMVRKKRSE